MCKTYPSILNMIRSCDCEGGKNLKKFREGFSLRIYEGTAALFPSLNRDAIVSSHKINYVSASNVQ
jgi:hypothetical protein